MTLTPVNCKEKLGLNLEELLNLQQKLKELRKTKIPVELSCKVYSVEKSLETLIKMIYY